MTVSTVRGGGSSTLPNPSAIKAPPQANAAQPSTSGPAATVELSPQAIAAASSAAKPSTAQSPPQGANSIKIALKESNEPLQLLTRQAKHGDVVAKLLLKQIQKKQQGAAQSKKPASPAPSSAAPSDQPEEPTEPRSAAGEREEAPAEAPAAPASVQGSAGANVDQHA